MSETMARLTDQQLADLVIPQNRRAFDAGNFRALVFGLVIIASAMRVCAADVAEVEPRIQIANPREFLRELSVLGSSTSIADLDVIARTTGWKPVFVQEGEKTYRASHLVRSNDSNIRYITVGYSTRSGTERGGMHIFVRPDLYCIRLSDAESIFGKPVKIGRPVHTAPRESEGLVYTVTFDGRPTRFVITFAYRECARSIDVFKN